MLGDRLPKPGFAIRDLLEADARYEPLLERWKKTESDEALLKAMSDYEAANSVV